MDEKEKPPTERFFEHLLIKCRLVNANKLQNFTRSTSLYKRIRKQLGWSKVIANIALVAYSEFMEMKLITKDFDTSYIVPSWCVREVWKTHALCDAKGYGEGCIGLCGRLIRYHVEVKPEQDNQYNEFEIYTERVYLTRFNRHLPKPIWSFKFDPYWKNEYQTEKDLKYSKKVRKESHVLVGTKKNSKTGSANGKKSSEQTSLIKSNVIKFYKKAISSTTLSSTTPNTSNTPSSGQQSNDTPGPSHANNSNNSSVPGPSSSKIVRKGRGAKRPLSRASTIMTRSRSKILKFEAQ